MKNCQIAIAGFALAAVFFSATAEAAPENLAKANEAISLEEPPYIPGATIDYSGDEPVIMSSPEIFSSPKPKAKAKKIPEPSSAIALLAVAFGAAVWKRKR